MNPICRLTAFLFWMLINPMFLHSQVYSFFDVVPDLGSLNEQGQGMNIMADSQHIYVLGDLIDAVTVPGDTVIRPFFARLDYEGNLQATHILYDSTAPGEFWMHTGGKPIYSMDGALLFYTSQLDSMRDAHACMMELDALTGNVNRYHCYPHPPSLDNNHVAQNYSRDEEGNIIAYHYLYEDRRVAIRKISSDMTILQEIQVEEHTRWNHPSYIESDSDSTFLLVGNSIAPPGGPYPESKIFYMRVDTFGSILDYALIPGIHQKTVGFAGANSYTVLPQTDGTWIISGIIAEVINQQGNQVNIIPFSVNVSASFDSLLWMTSLSELAYDERQYYFLTSSCWAADSSGFVVTGHDFLLEDRNSFLTKLDADGNKLWTRYFIPTGWSKQNILWANIEVVKPTPYNTYIMTGTFFDRDNYVRRPWVLHVDSMGCLVPGCDQIVDIMDPSEGSYDIFTIYPNPASDHIGILCTSIPGTDHFAQIFLIDTNGNLVKSTRISLIAGGQYILDVEDLTPGFYFIKVVTLSSGYVHTQKIIKI